MKVDAKRAELVPLTHPIHSIGPKTHVLGCFALFCCCTKVGAKQAELVQLTTSLLNEVASKIFATNTTNPLRLTQNS
jgi:hypothetical protein